MSKGWKCKCGSDTIEKIQNNYYCARCGELKKQFNNILRGQGKA